MNRILVLDTSTEICATAVYQNENLLSTICLHQANVHSEKAAYLVEQVLEVSQISVQEITHIAFAKGPGSYTGLRIGMSVIKGMAYASNIPVLSYSTLWGQAATFSAFISSPQLMISCLDAGRNEIYASVYNSFGDLVFDFQAITLPDTILDTFLIQSQGVIVGNAASKICKYHFINSTNWKCFSKINNPTEGLGKFLIKKIQNNVFDDLLTLEPNYLKPVQITIGKKTK